MEGKKICMVNLHILFCTVKRKYSSAIVCQFGTLFMLHLGGTLFLQFGSLLHLNTFITFEALMLGPKCNNGFITFRTNGLLHLGSNFVTFRTFITFKTNLVLHLGPLLHLASNPYYI